MAILWSGLVTLTVTQQSWGCCCFSRRQGDSSFRTCGIKTNPRSNRPPWLNQISRNNHRDPPQPSPRQPNNRHQPDRRPRRQPNARRPQASTGRSRPPVTFGTRPGRIRHRPPRRHANAKHPGRRLRAPAPHRPPVPVRHPRPAKEPRSPIAPQAHSTPDPSQSAAYPIEAAVRPGTQIGRQPAPARTQPPAIQLDRPPRPAPSPPPGNPRSQRDHPPGPAAPQRQPAADPPVDPAVATPPRFTPRTGRSA
jgi:hypothetical protein